MGRLCPSFSSRDRQRGVKHRSRGDPSSKISALPIEILERLFLLESAHLLDHSGGIESQFGLTVPQIRFVHCMHGIDCCLSLGSNVAPGPFTVLLRYENDLAETDV